MDSVDLFVGSEGTLGVITQAELRLIDAPRGEIIGGVVMYPDDDSALAAVERWQANPSIRMIEYFDRESLRIMNIEQKAALMVELEGDDLDLTGALEAQSWFALSSSDRERLRQFRHALPERVNALVRQNGFAKQSSDCAVPLEHNREMLEYYRVRLEKELPGAYTIFGHVGDAHLHVNVLPRNQPEFDRGRDLLVEFAQKAVELGGTFGAEHGLGKRKAHLLARLYSTQELAVMRDVKRRFDPGWLLGQGTLIPFP
jgi:FAD/FMN-containing dehydrogenase